MDSIKLSSQGERGLKMFVDITISVQRRAIQKSRKASPRPTANVDRPTESATSIKDLDSETEKCVVV